MVDAVRRRRVRGRGCGTAPARPRRGGTIRVHGLAGVPSAPMPTAARSPRWNGAARAPATGWDARHRARIPCRLLGRCRRPSTSA